MLAALLALLLVCACRVGEAKVPGPPDCEGRSGMHNAAVHELGETDSPTITILSANVTTLRPHLGAILDTLNAETDDVQVCCVQEHATPKHLSLTMETAAAARKAVLRLGPVDPNAKKPAAGVGIIGNAVMKPQPLAIQSPELRRFELMGRVALSLIDAAGQRPLRIANVYGWTDADSKPEARTNTEKMMSALFDELASHSTPFLVLGDLNASVGVLPSVHDRVVAGDL
eukprot:5765308-Alexandrium_andersonii.AAC.1